MRFSGECCHYDEGYDDGFADGQKELPPGAVEPADIARLLLLASRALYRSDPQSILALDCERAAERIAAEVDGRWPSVMFGLPSVAA